MFWENGRSPEMRARPSERNLPPLRVGGLKKVRLPIVECLQIPTNSKLFLVAKKILLQSEDCDCDSESLSLFLFFFSNFC